MYGETDSLRDDVGIRDSISSNISAPLFGETNPQVRDISYFSGKPTLRFGIFLSFRGKTLRFGIFLTFWGKTLRFGIFLSFVAGKLGFTLYRGFCRIL